MTNIEQAGGGAANPSSALHALPDSWRRPAVTAGGIVAVVGYLLLIVFFWKAAVEHNPPDMTRLSGGTLAGGFVGALVNPSSIRFAIGWMVLVAGTVLSIVIVGWLAVFETGYPAALTALGVFAAALAGLLVDSGKFSYRHLI